MPHEPTHLIQRIERYYDAVPRHTADVELVGPFTLFVARQGWPFYARPTLGWQPGHVTADDVEQMRTRQRERGVPEAFEWVAELAPDLATACRDTGLTVRELPLMVHHDPVAVPVPDGIRVRRLSPDDPAVAAGQVVAQLAFAEPGTTVGHAGAAERDAALEIREPSASDSLRSLMREDRSVYVVAEDEHGVLCAGGHNPVGEVTELVGIGTLPAARRRGLAAAVAGTLVADAVRRGLDVAFLSADGADVARVYEQVGFRRVATAMIAEVSADGAVDR